MVEFVLGASIMLNIIFISGTSIIIYFFRKKTNKLDIFGLPKNLDVREFDFL